MCHMQLPLANESRLNDMCVCTFPQKTVSGVTFVSGPPLRLLVCLSDVIGATTRHPGAVHFWKYVSHFQHPLSKECLK